MAKPDHDPEDQSDFSLFQEPSDYYPPSPQPTTETHKLLSGAALSVSLVGHNPLWGHHLVCAISDPDFRHWRMQQWNAGRLISTYLESNPVSIKNKTVLELGAGAGLPSLVCAEIGARRVVVTDYPDPDLVKNLQRNVDVFYERGNSEERTVVAEGYCWGNNPAPLLAHLSEAETSGFDVLILADLLFNHSEHGKLVATIQATLKKDSKSKALVFFTPYRPWLLEKDLAFFELVKEKGMLVEKVLEEKMGKVMFEEDRGDEELRKTVFGYVVKWDL